MSGIAHNQRISFLNRKWDEFDIQGKNVDTLVSELTRETQFK